MTETKDGGAGTVEVEVSFILRMIATESGSAQPAPLKTFKNWPSAWTGSLTLVIQPPAKGKEAGRDGYLRTAEEIVSLATAWAHERREADRKREAAKDAPTPGTAGEGG
jgi:hypothetical protein